jgi:DNA polymerase
MEKEEQISAADFLPDQGDLESLRAAARSCEGCDLYRNATQTVFGEGAEHASIIFVGEQPGDVEDRQGHPFVGPAGRMLDKALAEAHISRDQVYITNAVKHFRWIQRGKRRLHQKPAVRQVIACKPWLRAEIESIHPKLIVCLGATAAQSILGRVVPIGQARGKFFNGEGGEAVFITIHPSAIFRQQEKSDQEQEYHRFVADIRLVERKLRGMAAA